MEANKKEEPLDKGRCILTNNISDGIFVSTTRDEDNYQGFLYETMGERDPFEVTVGFKDPELAAEVHAEVETWLSLKPSLSIRFSVWLSIKLRSLARHLLYRISRNYSRRIEKKFKGKASAYIAIEFPSIRWRKKK